jgi:tripeptidyl-peptidase I
VVKEKILDKNVLHEVVLVLKQKNLDYLKSLVDEISDPDHRNYQNFLSMEKVHSLTTNLVLYSKVKEIMENRGFVVRKDGNYQYMTVSASVAIVEQMFQAEFFSGKIHDLKFVSSNGYIIPLELRDHIDSVFGIIDYPTFDEMDLSDSYRRFLSESGDENYLDSLEILKSVYDIRNLSSSPYATQAIFATSSTSVNGSASLADIRQFQNLYGIPEGSIGANNGQLLTAACSSCDTSNMLLEYATAVAQKSPTSLYFYSSSTSNYWVSWIKTVSAMRSPPLVITIGYLQYEKYITKAVAQAFQNEAVKLSAAGVTLVASSGIDGVAGPNARSDSTRCGYYPLFPATCPYVTVVGSTMVREYYCYVNIVINLFLIY